tara:strand:+ start:2453 stop:3061 length:609 start_codon:yes stop_codon:yes gene_type:complete
MNNSILKIPLFPISVSILPDELMPLHIFEDRYKNMISESLENNKEFGIIYKEKKDMKNIGCLVSIKKVYQKYDDGKYDILIKGEKRFEIKSLFKKGELLIGEIELLNEFYEKADKNKFNQILDKYLKLLLTFKIDHDIQSEMNKKKSFDFTKNILIPNNIKQDFLELENETDRMVFIDDFLDTITEKAKNKKNKLFNGNIFN